MSVINRIIELSNVARKEGLLALEEVASGLEDEFMKKGILLIVDGTEPELVRGILETEMDFMEERHSRLAGFWDTIASMGPAWGMIGTLIGLINMLKAMGDDMSAIGPNMATALITTLYGSVIANWIAIPTSNKLKDISAKEYQSRALVVEGLCLYRQARTHVSLKRNLSHSSHRQTEKELTLKREAMPEVKADG